jgi:transposase
LGRTAVAVPRGDGSLRFLPSLGSLVCCAGSRYASHRSRIRQAVRPGGKNDTADAEAIAVAARQPTMRFVAIKSVEQRAILAWHNVREGLQQERTALLNRTRGLMAEFGVVIAPS